MFPKLARLANGFLRALQIAQTGQSAGQHVERLRPRPRHGRSVSGVINRQPGVPNGILESMEPDVEFRQISVDVGRAVNLVARQVSQPR